MGDRENFSKQHLCTHPSVSGGSENATSPILLRMWFMGLSLTMELFGYNVAILKIQDHVTPPPFPIIPLRLIPTYNDISNYL